MNHDSQEVDPLRASLEAARDRLGGVPSTTERPFLL
jgi:hypothetical protein